MLTGIVEKLAQVVESYRTGTPGQSAAGGVRMGISVSDRRLRCEATMVGLSGGQITLMLELDDPNAQDIRDAAKWLAPDQP